MKRIYLIIIALFTLLLISGLISYTYINHLDRDLAVAANTNPNAKIIIKGVEMPAFYTTIINTVNGTTTINDIRRLIETGANVNAKVKDSGTEYPILYMLARFPQDSAVKVDIANLLIQEGADPNAKIISQRNPTSILSNCLMYTQKNWSADSEIIKVLIQAGANVNERIKFNGNDMPVLALAVQAANAGKIDPTIIKLMIDHGADANAKVIYPNDQGTVLCAAVAEGKKIRFDDLMVRDITKLLVESGANVKMETKKGHSIIEIAEKNGYHKTAELLKEYACN